MKLITRDTDYAIRALFLFVKNREDIVSVSLLVKELDIPRPFLRKILQVLTKKGILKSYKGQGGGFKLNVDPSTLSLLKLIEIFQGPFKLNDCIFKKDICPNVRICKVKKKIDMIQKHVVSELSNTTIVSFTKYY